VSGDEQDDGRDGCSPCNGSTKMGQVWQQGTSPSARMPRGPTGPPEVSASDGGSPPSAPTAGGRSEATGSVRVLSRSKERVVQGLWRSEGGHASCKARAELVRHARRHEAAKGAYIKLQTRR
jgi:hypothetical protein